MLIELTSLDGKKIAIDLTRAESIEEYGKGSKIRYPNNGNGFIKDFYLKETTKEICDKANEISKNGSYNLTIIHRNSRF